ncbi:MAG: RHS repeat-associated core domain-containing protein, partial [Anaerolineales bacterium]|nr:RHS repeat-associated core domain-containing protein [Anaerolineales bacterium]
MAGDPVTANNGLFFIYGDHLGSTTMLGTSSGGMVVGSLARYRPFGSYRTTPTQTLTDRDFTGQRENRELGLLYYQARFYVPSIGRFASADTLIPDPTSPQNFNRYTYVLNSPVRYSDPTGHYQQAIKDIDGWTIGLGTLSALAMALQNTDMNFNWDNVAYWEQGHYEEMWAVHDALVAAEKAVFTESVESNEGNTDDAEESTPSTESPIAKGLQRDSENNITGHPLGTPTNLPSPDASQEEIQEALGPDWSPPANPKANWTNKNSGEWLRCHFTPYNVPEINGKDAPLVNGKDAP